MATLIDVLSEFFRAFGYTPTLGVELEGTTGRRHALPLLLEKDSRRLAVGAWLHRQAIGPAFLTEFTDAVKDTGCDGGLVVSLGAVPDALLVQAAQDRILVWDSRRAAQELGSAVLRETCPDVWEQADPWVSPRPSKILDQLHQTVLAVETPPAVAAPVNEPTAEPAFPAAVAPMLAPPEAAAPETLEMPLAFSVLDVPAAPPEPPAPTQAVVPSAPTVPAPPPGGFVPPAYVPVAAAGVPSRGRNVLRVQVSKALVTSLARPKIRTVDRVFLRLVPFYVFDYEASLLIEGSLETQKQTGRISVDGSTKKVKPWLHGLELGALPDDGVDLDEKPVRLQEGEARKLVTAELRTLVTRDVVMEEDDSEWSVVVKKKVELSDEELRLTLQGVYWTPVWRASGKDGSVEIDATNGQFVFEDVSAQKSDALLI